MKPRGATSVPDLLRMVPGLHVARIDTQTWAISARGFNDRSSNKLLVLIDGRSVYTPLFSGVNWDERDVMLEDVERIEVIRGPGGALWGSNAVNGVINITTKKSRDSQGGLVTIGAGTQEQGFAGARYGGQMDENTHYRVYAKGFERDALEDKDGSRIGRDWEQIQGGARLDWESDDNAVTLQGDIYEGLHANTLVVRTSTAPFAAAQRFDEDIRGGNILTKWTRKLSSDSQFHLKFYYDHTYRNFEHLLKRRHETYDLEFQHSMSPAISALIK